MEFLLLADAHEEAFRTAMRHGELEAFLSLLGSDVRPDDLARVAKVSHKAARTWLLRALDLICC